MKQGKPYDAIIVLGGGRTNQGELTELSKQRLDKGVELFKRGRGKLIFAIGSHYGSYGPKGSIHFKPAGAKLRRDYLIERNIPLKSIIMVKGGGDTVCEAFASRKKTRELGLKKILLVTSDKHMRRALFIFRRIFGKNFQIGGSSIDSGDLLNEDEERESLEAIRRYFANLPEEIPESNLETWYENNADLYCQYKKIHDRYHPPGKESQAYMGTR